jgi:RNA polymerase sigma factor (sigma-70 family)
MSREPTSNARRGDSSVDRLLIKECLNGNQAAWEELVSQYERLVYSIACAICRQRADASDVFQQVWLELYKRLPDLRNLDTLPAWLITVTRRRAYAYLKSKLPEVPLEQDIPEVSDQLRAIEEEHAIDRAIGQLSPRCQRLIDLLYSGVAQKSYAEISAEMDIPVSSIGPTRARCLEKLRELLGANVSRH